MNVPAQQSTLPRHLPVWPPGSHRFVPGIDAEPSAGEGDASGSGRR